MRKSSLIATSSTKVIFGSLCEQDQSYRMTSRPTQAPETLLIFLKGSSSFPILSRLSLKWLLYQSQAKLQQLHNKHKNTPSFLTAFSHRQVHRHRFMMKCSTLLQAFLMVTMCVYFHTVRQAAGRLTPWAQIVWPRKIWANKVLCQELFTKFCKQSILINRSFASLSRKYTVTRCVTCWTQPT